MFYNYFPSDSSIPATCCSSYPTSIQAGHSAYHFTPYSSFPSLSLVSNQGSSSGNLTTTFGMTTKIYNPLTMHDSLLSHTLHKDLAKSPLSLGHNAEQDKATFSQASCVDMYHRQLTRGTMNLYSHRATDAPHVMWNTVIDRISRKWGEHAAASTSSLWNSGVKQMKSYSPKLNKLMEAGIKTRKRVCWTYGQPRFNHSNITGETENPAPVLKADSLKGSTKTNASADRQKSIESNLTGPKFQLSVDYRTKGESRTKRPRDCETHAAVDPTTPSVKTKARLRRIPNLIGPYICCLCGHEYGDPFKLAGHRCPCIMHADYKCPECEKVFNCPANLASHRRWHKPKIPNSSITQPKTEMFRNPTNGKAKPLIPTFNMISSNPSNNLHQRRNSYHHSPSTQDFPAQGNSDARRVSYTNLNSKDEEFSRRSDSQSQRTRSPKIYFSVESILGSCDKLKGIPVRSPEKLLSRQPVSQFIDLSKTECKEYEGRSPRNQSNFTSQNVRCNGCGIRLKRQGELETHMLEHILDIANSCASGTSG